MSEGQIFNSIEELNASLGNTQPQQTTAEPEGQVFNSLADLEAATNGTPVGFTEGNFNSREEIEAGWNTAYTTLEAMRLAGNPAFDSTARNVVNRFESQRLANYPSARFVGLDQDDDGIVRSIAQAATSTNIPFTETSFFPRGLYDSMYEQPYYRQFVTPSISAPNRTNYETMREGFRRATDVAGLGVNAAIQRMAHDAFNLDQDWMAANRGMTREQAEEVVDTSRADYVRDRRQQWAAQDANQPFWREGDSLSDNVDRYIAHFVGDMLGNASPLDLIGGGMGLARNILVQAAVSGAMDGGLQIAERGEGIRDNYDWRQTAISAGAGGALGGAVHGIGAGFRRMYHTPVENVVTDTPPVETGHRPPEGDRDLIDIVSGEEHVAFQEAVRETARRFNIPKDRIDEALGQEDFQRQVLISMIQKGDQDPQLLSNRNLEYPVGTQGELWSPSTTRSVRKPEAAPEQAPRAPEPIQQEMEFPSALSQEQVVTEANRLSSEWANSPDIIVAHSVDQIQNPEVRAELEALPPEDLARTQGFLASDGKVYLLSNNISDMSAVRGTLFHEALGHKGLSNAFGRGLDDALLRFYEGGGRFAAEVDHWRAENPDTYHGREDQLAREIEEAFAEMSENGTIDATLWERIKAFIRDFGRRAGYKVEMSDSDIRAVLRSAHRTVTDGRGVREGGPSGLGSRFIRTWHGTPNKFDRFNHEYMGSGEGQQVFGWGTYLTETRSIGEGYRNVLSNNRFSVDLPDGSQRPLKEIFEGGLQRNRNAEIRGDLTSNQRQALDWAMEEAQVLISETGKPIKSFDEFLGTLDAATRANYLEVINTPEARRAANNLFSAAYSDISVPARQGHLLEVELPDNAHWLEWDKPLAEQTPEVQQRLNELGIETPSYSSYAQERQSLLTRIKEINRELDVLEDSPTYSDNISTVRELDLELDALQRKLDGLQTYASGERIYDQLADRYGSPRAASEALNEVGISGNRYLDGNSRNAGEGSYNYVVFSDQTPRVTNRYSRKPRARQNGEDGKPNPNRFQGNSLTDMRSARDVARYIREAEEAAPDLETQSHMETIIRANEMDMTAQDFLNWTPDVTPERMYAARGLILTHSERVARLAREIRSGRGNDQTRVEFLDQVGMLQQLVSHYEGSTRLVAQTMNSLRIAIGKARDGGYDLRYLMRDANIGNFRNIEDVDALAERIAMANNPQQELQAVRDIMKPHWEDYITSFRYNAMLSGMGTQAKAIIGTLSNMILNNIDLGVAAVLGQFRRNGDTALDRVTGREWVTRNWAMLRGFVDIDAYAKAVRAYREGHTSGATPDRYDINVDVTLPGSMVTEYSRRGLAAIDGYFRHIIEQSEMYGQATRVAIREGLTGDAVSRRVEELVRNPTKEMREQATQQANVQQLLDSRNPLVNMLDVGKSRRSTDGADQRILRFVLANAFPFVRNSVNMVDQTIRHTPIFNMLHGETRKMWRAGGAQRDIVLSRMAVGSSLIALGAYLGSDGINRLRGAAPSEVDQREQATSSGFTPNSILINGKWHSLSGIDAVALPLTLGANLSQNYQRGQETGLDTYEQVLQTLAQFSNMAANEGFIDQFSNFGALLASGTEDSAGREMLVSGASSFVPAALRNTTYYGDDRFVRDTTGDGSLRERIAGRIGAALPEGARSFVDFVFNTTNASRLPFRVDLYGRPVEREGGNQVTGAMFAGIDPETDAIAQEVTRLSRNGEVILRRVGKYISRNGDRITLDAIQRNQFQALVGTGFVEEATNAMNDPIWQTMTDDQKRNELRIIYDDVQRQVRNELHDSDEFRASNAAAVAAADQAREETLDEMDFEMQQQVPEEIQ